VLRANKSRLILSFLLWAMGNEDINRFYMHTCTCHMGTACLFFVAIKSTVIKTTLLIPQKLRAPFAHSCLAETRARFKHDKLCPKKVRPSHKF